MTSYYWLLLKIILHSPILVSSHTNNYQSVVHFLSSVTMTKPGHEEDKRPRYAGHEPIFLKVPCYNHFPIKNTQFGFLQTLVLCCEAIFIYCHKITLVRWVLYKIRPSVQVDQALLYIKCNWLLVTCFSCVFVAVRLSVTHTSPRKSWSITATRRASRWRLTAPWAPLKDPGQWACPSHSRDTNNTQISAPHLLQNRVTFFYFKTKKGKLISIFQHSQACHVFCAVSLSLWPLFLFVWNIGTPCEKTIGSSVLVELLSDSLARTQWSFMVTPLRELQGFRESEKCIQMDTRDEK